jgi:F-type H+-transporting ATPase subunit b
MPLSLPFTVLLSGGGSPIDLDGSFFVQLAIFFVAFFILKGLVFGPVMRLFDARSEAMEGSREAAAQMTAKAEQTRGGFEDQLRSVRQKANEERDKRRAEAQQLARELTEKARRENTAHLSGARARLDTEAREARTKAQTEVPALARQIAEQLLGRSVA